MILGDIKVGDRVRLISISPKTAAGFPAEGKVMKVDLQGADYFFCIQAHLQR